MDSQLPNVQIRLGGPWLISWPSFFFSLPLLLLNIVSNINLSKFTDEIILRILLVALELIVGLGVCMFFLVRYAFPNRGTQQVELWKVVSGFFSAGVLVGATTSILLEKQDIAISRGATTNGILTGIFLVWWGSMITLLLDGRARFSEQRNVVIERAVQIELARLQEAEVSQLMRISIRKEIDAELTSARESFAARLEKGEFEIKSNEWSDVASSIRDTANNIVRPMSRRLKDKASKVYPPPTFFAFIKNIIHNQPFRPGALTLIYLVRTGPIEVEHFGLETGLLSYLAVASVFFISMTLANFLMRTFPKNHAWIFLDTILIIQVFYMALHLSREYLTGIQIPNGELVSNLITSVFLIFVTSGFGTFRNIHQDMMSSFSKTLTKNEIEVLAESIQLSRLATEAADLLHGQVQTKLVSCAAAIDQARLSGNVEQFNRALMQARAILELPLLDQVADHGSTVEREIARKCKLWDGLCEIHLDLPESIGRITGKNAFNIGRIIEEAISNSMRHGLATQIKIVLRENIPGTIFLTVTDNGIGPQQGHKGQGSDTLSVYSSGTNVLERNPDGPGSILSLSVGLS